MSRASGLAVACAVICAVGVSGCSADSGEQVQSGGAAVKGVVTLPIHGVDSHYSYPYKNAGTKLVQDVRIEKEAPYMFWATKAFNEVRYSRGKASDGVMYMGVKTNATRPDGTVGKVGIFSVWGATAADGPGCSAFNEFESGWTCHIRLDFGKNDLVYQMEFLRNDGQGDWWRAKVIVHAGYGWPESELTIGEIRLPPNVGAMNATANFSEIWGGTYEGCRDIPGSLSIWEQPYLSNPFVGNFEGKFDYAMEDSCANGNSSGRDTHPFEYTTMGY